MALKIGDALRFERLQLGLTQKQMCGDILTRPYYAKVEACKNSITAENLFRILLAHDIDIMEFFNLIKNTYESKENNIENELKDKFGEAFSSKDIENMKKYYKEILNSGTNNVLKLRAVVSIAYLENNLDKLDPKIKQRIKKEFDEGKNWTVRPDLLRLLANTMPLWSQDELDFWIGRLLKSAQKDKLSNLMLERYLRMFENYLVTCYERKVLENRGYYSHIKDVIEYIIKNASSYNLMIYRINAMYMQALFRGDMLKVKDIRNDIEKYGYGNLISTWPQ